MSRFQVRGADRESGQSKSLVIQAENEQEAEAIANVRGLMVSEIDSLPDSPSPSMAQFGQAATPGSSAIQNNIVITHAAAGHNPAVAAILSFLMPGLGQMYKGQIINGVVWFIVVLIGYVALILPGIILHILCILGAASGNKKQAPQVVVSRQ